MSGKESYRTSTTFKIALAAMFAALVFVATYTFVINIPATGGYFNLGEIVIYVAALVFGPLVGCVAGGVGAAVSDALVAPQFAPGTLIIKAFEGAVVGYLGKRRVGQITASKWRALAVLLGTGVGLLLAITGALYLSGEVSLYLGIPPPVEPTVSFFVPGEVWYGLGALSALLIIYVCLKVEPQTGWNVFSIIPGGLVMVTGYFLYETLVLGQATAYSEIPLNIGQMLIGLIIAIPITRFVLRSFPQLKS
jgi:uncharacterized membrane protein